MQNEMLFSIIIPVKEINDYIRETVTHIKTLSKDDWELIILPNSPTTHEWSDVRIRTEPTGKVSPGSKRNLGAEIARGDILVFLDDDSYPTVDLLNIAEGYFQDQAVAALGGPAVTPKDNTFWQRVSGAVFLSRFSGGYPERYLPVGNARPVDDWPSVNLMVRRLVFLRIGGFDTTFWPGEDTKLCRDLVKLNNRILYIPNMIVWHHRRTNLIAHLKQIGAYGLHRGYFAKNYPETSRKVIYFIPSLFALFVISIAIVPLISRDGIYYIAVGLFIYSISLIKSVYDIAKVESLTVALAAILYIIPTHFLYGVLFAQGILTKTLVSRLR